MGMAAVKWSANSDPDLAVYRIYYGTAPGQYLQVRGKGLPVTSTSFTLSDLPVGTRYYFAVTAVDIAGNESALSAEASKTIQ